MEQILYVLPSCGRNAAGSIVLSQKRKKNVQDETACK